jgi:hypothetical protein
VLQEVWCGIVHHIVDEHEWEMSYRSNVYGENKCQHGPLEEGHKEWMENGGPAHKALIEIVFNKKLLNQISYNVNFR